MGRRPVAAALGSPAPGSDDTARASLSRGREATARGEWDGGWGPSSRRGGWSSWTS